VIWSVVETLHLSQRPTPGHITYLNRSNSCRDKLSSVACSTSELGFLPLLEEMADEGHNGNEGKQLENTVVLNRSLEERFQSIEEGFQDLGKSF